MIFFVGEFRHQPVRGVGSRFLFPDGFAPVESLDGDETRIRPDGRPGYRLFLLRDVSVAAFNSAAKSVAMAGETSNSRREAGSCAFALLLASCACPNVFIQIQIAL